MSRYDGLIIPRSYSEYINKTDAATLQQALQQNNVLSAAVAAGDNKAVKSGAVATALANYDTKGNQSIIAKNDANLCIPNEQTELINFVAYGSNKNLPTTSNSYFIRTQRSVSYIVQFASNVQNDVTKTEPDYIRKAVLSGKNWSFSPWEKITTESDLNNYANNTKNTDTKTVETTNFTTLQTYTVQKKGIYVVLGSISFETNSNGIRICMITTNENDTSNNADNSTLGSGRTDLQRLSIFAFNGGETVYLRAYQNCGSSLSTRSQLTVLQLG